MSGKPPCDVFHAYSVDLSFASNGTETLVVRILNCLFELRE